MYPHPLPPLPTPSPPQEAYDAFSNGHYEKALIHYELAGDHGSVLGQTNAAFLYQREFIQSNDLGYPFVTVTVDGEHGGNDDHFSPSLSTPSSSPSPTASSPLPPTFPTTNTTTPVLKAMNWYRLAGSRKDANSALQLGDYYYDVRQDYAKAGSSPLPPPPLFSSMPAKYYRDASLLASPQASFNIGFMHHFGIGLDEDLHLAKRYYDLAIVHSPQEAYLPAQLPLLLIQLQLLFREWGSSPDSYLPLFKSLETDTVLLITLSVVLILLLTMRHCLLR